MNWLTYVCQLDRKADLKANLAIDRTKKKQSAARKKKKKLHFTS